MAAMREMALLMMAAAAEARAKVAVMAAVRSAALATMALSAILVVPAEVRPIVVVIAAVRATMLTAMAAVAVAVATAVTMTTAMVTLAAAVAMVTVEVRATAMATAVTLAAASIGRDSTMMHVCNAILMRYADIVDARSNDDGNCSPAFNRGNIDRGVADKNSSRVRRLFAQCKLPSWIKQPLPLPPSRHPQFGGHFTSKR